MTAPSTTFIIVTRNSKLILAACLDSVLNQTNRDFSVAVIDNDSSDGTPEFVRRNYPMVAMIENSRNLGFAKANNQAIRLFKTPFLVLCNPDVVLQPDWLEKIMQTAASQAGSGFDCFGGQLRRLKLISAETGEIEKTEKLDSCGLRVEKSHRILEVGAGEAAEKYVEAKEVFGFSGALVMYCRAALSAVALKDKFHASEDLFDGSFFVYKEDVDLSWRLRLANHKSFFVPEAVAYHLRTYGADKDSVIKSRRQQSDPARYYSYRNQILLLLEDEYAANLFRYLPQIAWYELKKLCYILFFEPKNLRAWTEIFGMLPEIRAKRRAVLTTAKISAKEIRKWYR